MWALWTDGLFRNFRNLDPGITSDRAGVSSEPKQDGSIKKTGARVDVNLGATRAVADFLIQHQCRIIENQSRPKKIKSHILVFIHEGRLQRLKQLRGVGV